jgi:hypothetical protein
MRAIILVSQLLPAASLAHGVIAAITRCATEMSYLLEQSAEIIRTDATLIF